MEKVINQVIRMVEHLRLRISDLEFITQSYHEWKNEKEEFTKHIQGQIEKFSKNGDNDSVSNDRRQDVPEQTQSNNS